MGCDLCVYLPDNGDHDCAMAYSSFNRLRNSIIALYLQKMGKEVELTDGEDFNLMVGVTSMSLIKKVSKALEEIGTEEAYGLKVLWEHSDCDGNYWSDDCLSIGHAIKSIIDMFDEDDDDKCWAEGLADMFIYAGEHDGIVEVC